MAALLALAAVKSYRRVERGHVEQVRGYTKAGTKSSLEHPGGWIPEKDWLKGQAEWKARGEAVREVIAHSPLRGDLIRRYRRTEVDQAAQDNLDQASAAYNGGDNADAARYLRKAAETSADLVDVSRYAGLADLIEDEKATEHPRAPSSAAKRAASRIKEQAASGTKPAGKAGAAVKAPEKELEIPPDGQPELTPYAEVGGEDATGWANDLPDFDQLAVNDYVSNEGSQAINGALRAGHLPENGTADPVTFDAMMFGYGGRNPENYRRGDEVRALDRLERKYTTTKPASLYRGMALSPELKAKLRPGAIFTDKGFTSTSTDPYMAEQFAQLRTTGHFTAPDLNAMGAKALGGEAVLLHIIVPKGAHLIPGESDAQISEYVLPRGGRNRVEKILPPGTYSVPTYVLTALGPGKAS